ncbi:ATP-grasp domain-containing protein [Starkeya koreensis]|uniref:ATP-grasp domain-containing protein n=1 Tax=Ancylobacter koreensis TaxID=266121 RepID=A0ABT0DNW7_9HYPH|nr:ATP-grasp domain-containing protein [Ancylobacter koreensis]MCK0208977.1 ATP-grasp domain-containing protein [Ancylobacter koreensis]
MPSSWRDHSRSRDEADVVIVGIAARALAAAARRAGHRAIVLDLFGDDDTRELAVEAIPLRRLGGFAIDPDDLFEQLAIHAGTDLPVVLGTGFEHAPEIVEALAARFRLVGNGPATLAALKEPRAFSALLGALGIPHPRVFAERAPAGVATLEKRIGGSGGWHVREADETRGTGWYLQERVEGRTVSALFLGDGRAARLLAFSEQWCEPGEDAPFRYGGAAGPIRLDPAVEGEVERALERIVGATGLVGLASADLVLGTRDGEWSLIEVNPRPGATLDVFDHAPLPPLFGLHLDACAGTLPELALLAPGPGVAARAAGVLYAPAAFERRLDALPDWVADRPPPGTRIEAGEPVCTVLADGQDAHQARENLSLRLDHLWRELNRAGRKAAE